MKRKPFLYLIILIVFCQCTNTLNTGYYGRNKSLGEIPKMNEVGKCYAKCVATDKFSTDSSKYIVYTGDETIEDVDIDIIEIQISPGSTKWEKRKADRNCRSADPNDCLVWCLVEVPAITQVVKILKDTTQSKNFEIRQVAFHKLVEKGGFMEWREVVCSKNVTSQLIGEVQFALQDLGYYSIDVTGVWDAYTRKELQKYQKNNSLPVGQLDIRTLEKLGLNLE